MEKEVAVIVLNWNGRKLLEEFMPSWTQYTPQDVAELILVDNGSDDDSVAFMHEHYPDVKLIDYDQNYGFAEGYNRAVQSVKHPIVVLLNSDAALSQDWLSQPLQLLHSDKRIAAVQPKIRACRNPEYFEYAGGAGGFIDRLGYPFCRGRIFDTVEKDQGQYDDVTDIFWASGACLIIRRDVYIECGGLDARFFAHQEEIDLCWRINSRGYRIVYAPSSVVYHVGGASLDMNSPRKCYLNFRNNLVMLYKNIPSDKLRRVLSRRFFLDYMSAVMFLLKGNTANFKAVLKARKDFMAMRSTFRLARKENLAATKQSQPRAIAPFCIVSQYYLLRRNTFSQLPHKHVSK